MPRANPDAPPIAGSALSLRTETVAAGASLTLGEAEDDVLLYVHAGTGVLSLNGQSATLGPRSAGLVLAGEESHLEATDRLDLIVMDVGPQVDRHAPMGPRMLASSLDAADAKQATSARSFQILFDATNGSTRATLFAGHLPPGKAPWHYHLYDEIVWVPDGPGRLYVGDAVEELGPGSAFRLRPREVHIVENTSSDRELTIIGLFTPAGSPSAAYLTPEAAAEYRFVG
jgi:quercetin dioxygenase-like cupin family protein